MGHLLQLPDQRVAFLRHAAAGLVQFLPGLDLRQQGVRVAALAGCAPVEPPKGIDAAQGQQSDRSDDESAPHAAALSAASNLRA